MKQGDRFEAIVKEYSQPLYWHIRRMVVCHEDAEDILHDTFASLFLHFWQIREPSKTKAWLYAVATNKSNRFLRRKSRELRCDDISEYLSDRIDDTEFVNHAQTAAVNLQKAFLKLPKAQQTVFNLRYFSEMNYEEISKITGTGIATLRVNYHIAKEKIINYIHEEEL